MGGSSKNNVDVVLNELREALRVKDGSVAIGSGDYCFVWVGKPLVCFGADEFIEFDVIPLVDEDLIRFLAAVNLLIPGHNEVSNVGLAITHSKDEVPWGWEVHIIFKHFEEYDILGASILLKLTEWLKDAWGADEAELNYFTHAEKAVITLCFRELKDVPKGLRDVIKEKLKLIHIKADA